MDRVDETKKEFTPPRHWVDLDELREDYWKDQKAIEKRDQEFYEKPIESLEILEKMDKNGVERREFLTIMGASMALASLGFARKPVHKIIPYVVKPKEATPGVPTWYASTYTDGAHSQGVLVKVREGRPIKLEGNPDHPLNRGKLNGRGQAALLDLYDPDRLKGPLSLTRNTGTKTKVTWSEANTQIQGILKAARAKGGRVRVLTGYGIGPSTERLIAEFLGPFSNGKHIRYEPGFLDQVADAQAASYGERSLPRYDFARAKVVLSLGADFLQNWISPTEHSIDWAKNRKVSANNPKMSLNYVFESTMTVTGSSADERFAVRPGDELKVALALAYELSKRTTRFQGNSTLASVLKAYSPRKIAEDIGSVVTPEKLREIADKLWANRGRSLVVGGSMTTATEHGIALQVAVNLLNEMLENEGKTVGRSGVLFRGGTKDFIELRRDLAAKKVDVLICYGANPLYYDSKFSSVIGNAGTIITVSKHLDETARLSDFALPDHHFLENWGDSQPRAGLFTLQQPVIHPLHDSWAFQDMLIKWAKTGGLPVSGLLGQMRGQQNASWHMYLKRNWANNYYSRFGGGMGSTMFWNKSLQKGVVGKVAGIAGRRFRGAALAMLPQFRKGSRRLTLALYENGTIGKGENANNPWLHEVPDPITTVTWDNYVNIAPATARRFNLRQNDVVKISAAEASRELPVNVQPGMHPDVVSIAVGYGRTSAGKVGTGVGVNVFAYGRIRNGRMVFSGHEVVTLEKTGRRYELAATQGHHRTKNRPIINDITLTEFKADPTTENHTVPHLRLKKLPSLWPKHQYPGYSWGMAIDLSSCTGCGACVTACQAENNIPVVGRSRVRTGREMHWIRIDRYYSGTENNPDLVFQPMLCQHCENASCETVCPVLATVHSDEGLNDMVYNRCVGTRYCQNNCPYKVRRFNFFDHWKDYDKPMNLVYNPDVTVRTRGVMEKCTFCVQRIQSARDLAKKEMRKIRDGDIKPACEQTCPSDCIVFGDLNDPNSRVAKLQAAPQAFRALEDLNNKPRISYLSKVRNKKKGDHDVHHHG